MSALQKSEPQPSAAIVPINDSAALMAAVARAAADPSVDVEKMERLFAMHERMEARQAQQAFADAMKAAQSEMPKIGKDRHNTQTKSDYATLDAINAEITPVYTRHGFSLSFDTADSPLAGHIRIVCHVLHSGGHEKAYTYDSPMDDKGIAGSVNKTPTHARGSAVTYGRRYLTLMIFNLSTGYDDDGNDADTDADHSAWPDAIEACVDQAGLKNVKAEMAKTFGGLTKIPPSLVRTYNAKWEAVK